MNDGLDQKTDSSTTFGNDDLGRIQSILLGNHANDVNERLGSLEEALLGAIADLRNDLQAEIVSVRQQLNAEQANRATAMTHLGDRIDSEAQQRREAEHELNAKLEAIDQSLHSSVDALAAEVATHIEHVAAKNTTDRDEKERMANTFASLADQLRERGSNQSAE